MLTSAKRARVQNSTRCTNANPLTNSDTQVAPDNGSHTLTSEKPAEKKRNTDSKEIIGRGNFGSVKTSPPVGTTRHRSPTGHTDHPSKNLNTRWKQQQQELSNTHVDLTAIKHIITDLAATCTSLV
ncbi:unnamed protein product, partial [Sphacelaria rigidula]